MKILISGASGFIGSRLASVLASDGHEVTAMCNAGQTPGKCKELRADLTAGPPDIPERYDVAYHLAAATPTVRSKSARTAINIAGAKNFARAAAPKCGRLVYATGAAIFGNTNGMPITASSEPAPDTGYAKERLEAQRAVESACREAETEFAAACLGDVYGDGSWLSSHVLGPIKKGRFRLPGGGKYVKSFVHVDDAASALAAVGGPGMHIISDSKPVEFAAFIAKACELVGAKMPGSVPAAIASIVLGRDMARMITTPVVLDGSAMASRYRPKFPTYMEGLADVLGRQAGRRS